jgi:hypothetical protein
MASRFFVSLMTLVSLFCIQVADAKPVSQVDAPSIAVEAYTYFYPLVTMDVTRRQLTNIEAGKMVGRGPANQFSHMRAFPTADFREVVRPNFDTLYSSAWLDLTKEPVVLSVPDTDGRYYLMPMLDMWTDVFAAPGSRTSGTGAKNFAIVPLNWKGKLPKDLERIDAPTPFVWMIGRTQTNGPSDYAAVHKIQDGYKLTPLSQWGKKTGPKAQPFVADASVDMKTSPLIQVNRMTGQQFFSYAADLIKLNSPHHTDWSQVQRFKHIGIEQGREFDFTKLSKEVQAAIERAPVDALKIMQEKIPTLAKVVNGWQMNVDSMGVYGNFYLKRAIVAMVGLGANQPEDAIYPLAIASADGKPLDGNETYVIRFKKDQLPPVGAFWSITMYDSEGFQAANALNRFAIGDRDPLKYNSDGSLEIYLQHESPGKDKEGNWLPAPKGPLGVTMRLYQPDMKVLDGRWTPPAIETR